MPWKPLDFQAITSIDQKLYDRLDHYLEEKESHLAHEILTSVHPLPGVPPLLKIPKHDIKLTEAVNNFSKTIQKISVNPMFFVSISDWKVTTHDVNTALWYYVEVLESISTELFQQLSQLGFESWSGKLFDLVVSMNEMLLHRIENLIWSVKRLEAALLEYRRACKSINKGLLLFFDKLLFLWKSLLDRTLLSALRKSEQYLKLNSNNFFERYRDYQQLNQEVEKTLKKFKRYHVLRNLNEDRETTFKNIYRLIRLWEKNQNQQALPEHDTMRVLRNFISPDQAFELFKEYNNQLKLTLFKRSRSFKKNIRETFLDDTGKSLIHEALSGYRLELHTLGATITKYRDFLLKSDPDPYIRSRWGFTEWIVAPEPQNIKRLLHLVYDVEKNDRFFSQLIHSFEEETKEDKRELYLKIKEKISETLHDMGQPLTSKILMKMKVEYLLECISDLDELGSFQKDVVSLLQKVFLKALRADWQYHVLFDYPLFFQLYDIHRGIVGEIENRKHFDRVLKFKEVISEVLNWVRKHDTLRHVHEIELDIHDLKSYFQDFLATVQHLSQNKKLSESKKNLHFQAIEAQVLEYRFLFGKFFHDLLTINREGKLVRKQFLFVDQYLESIENLFLEPLLVI